MPRRRLVIHIEYDHEEFDSAMEVVVAQERINEIAEIMQDHGLAAPWEFNYEWVEDKED